MHGKGKFQLKKCVCVCSFWDSLYCDPGLLFYVCMFFVGGFFFYYYYYYSYSVSWSCVSLWMSLHIIDKTWKFVWRQLFVSCLLIKGKWGWMVSRFCHCWARLCFVLFISYADCVWKTPTNAGETDVFCGVGLYKTWNACYRSPQLHSALLKS